jgi:hypothetical protein
MPIALTEDMIAPGTPDDVVIRTEAAPPFEDPTLGVLLTTPAQPRSVPKHRLVAVGDSLTQGFQNGAIFDTALSYPAIIARELGCSDTFSRPDFTGGGGLPVNIELLLHRLQERFGQTLDWFELPLAVFQLHSILDETEDYWERGKGASPANVTGIFHNLAIYGWDVRDIVSRNADICVRGIAAPKDNLLLWQEIVDSANDRTAVRVLNSARDANGRALSPVEAAAALASDGGIETLIVFAGANNVLAAVTHLKVCWSGDDYQDFDKKIHYTAWRPSHFEKEFAELAKLVEKIDAKNVIFGTVPHVTIAPIARGVSGQKVRQGSRYFPYYTRPWISDAQFDPREDPYLTAAEARALDSAIDQYNQCIAGHVKAARKNNRNWLLLDVAGLLDRLASRRYIADVASRPSWWTPYELPPELQTLRPVPDSLFFQSGPQGRTAGGLFSLDGIHPTTLAYGILAQEFINVMHLAEVEFYYGDGKTKRSGPVHVDFQRLIKLDTLISHPPASLSSDLRLIGWFDEKVDIFRRLFRKPSN